MAAITATIAGVAGAVTAGTKAVKGVVGAIKGGKKSSGSGGGETSVGGILSDPEEVQLDREFVGNTGMIDAAQTVDVGLVEREVGQDDLLSTLLDRVESRFDTR